MISKKSYGVDVAKYQPESLRVYAKAGAKYAIVQVSVSNSIVAPRAKAQITSAKANNIMPMGYFYGCFGHSATQAASEAHFAIKNAKSIGLPKGSYLGVDWERTDNNVNGNVSQNTAAIIQAMKVIRDAGYIPLLYSGADLLRNKINTKQIIKQFGTCLWVASYPVSSRVNTANFNYFPSMDGVAIWQFTDNWHGLSVAGDINVIDLKGTTKKYASKSKWVKKSGTFILGEALKIHTSPHINSPAIAKLQKGSVIKYDATLQGPLRLWLRQPRNNGKYGYVVGKDKYGKKLGKFK